MGRDLSREVLALKMRSEVYCIQGTDGSEVTREKRNWKWGVGEEGLERTITCYPHTRV